MIRLAAVLVLALVGAADAQAWRGSYPEGPLWHRGTLYWAEMTANRVMRAGDVAAHPVLVRDGCGPTALAPYGDGFAVLCHLDGSVVLVDADWQPVRVIRRSDDGHRLRDPNDAHADGRGGVWFTDPGTFSRRASATGAVLYLSADGHVTRHVTGLAYGNGIYVDRARGRLLVSEHLARRVLVYRIEPQGLGEAEVLINLDTLGLSRVDYAEAGPDGLEIGPEGLLWVAEYGAGRILVWDLEEGLVRTVATDPPYVTNIAFAPDGRTAITGAWQNARPPYSGETRVFSSPP